MSTKHKIKNKYIFKKYFKSECLHDTVTNEDLTKELVEYCLSRGYIPRNVTYQRNVFFVNRIDCIDRASCVGAFAGKKQARIIYEANKDQLK